MHRLKHKLTAVCSSKRCLMDFILRKFSIALLHFLVMCCLRLRLLSIHTPRYLMVSVLSTKSPAIFMVPVVHLLSWCWLPKYMNSILVVFIFRRVSSIHLLMLSMHSSIILTVLASSALSLALNSLLTLWSSANPFNRKLLGTTSCSVEQ